MVINWSAVRHVYIVCGKTDLRKGIDSLALIVEETQDTKSHTEKLINRFSKYYTPAVLVIAIAVGLITKDLRLAITVMVLDCPGALVIGVPVSTVAGIGNGAKKGIMFKGSQVMDQTHRIDEIAFDKTGTLTIGI